jgi:hypothetical protein
LIAQKITRCNEVTIQAQKQKPPTGKKWHDARGGVIIKRAWLWISSS